MAVFVCRKWHFNNAIKTVIKRPLSPPPLTAYRLILKCSSSVQKIWVRPLKTLNYSRMYVIFMQIFSGKSRLCATKFKSLGLFLNNRAEKVCCYGLVDLFYQIPNRLHVKRQFWILVHIVLYASNVIEIMLRKPDAFASERQSKSILFCALGLVCSTDVYIVF